MSVGDDIRMSIKVTGPTVGSAILENLNTGQTVSHSFSSSLTGLCQKNAEWIVEDFLENDKLVPLADFGTYNFTGCSASQGADKTVGVQGATVLDIAQGGQVLSSCSTIGSDGVTCSYAG